MSHHNENAEHLSPQETEDRIWKRAKDIGVCMLTSWSGTEQHSRPLSSHPVREEHAIYFLVDEAGHKNVEIAQYPQVSLAYVDKGSNDYVVISGEAEITDNRRMIAELFSSFARAWWDDENDPAIRLLTVTPHRGELWDGPSGPISKARVVLSATTGGGIDVGETGKTRM
jgi:general stress protein 26